MALTQEHIKALVKLRRALLEAEEDLADVPGIAPGGADRIWHTIEDYCRSHPVGLWLLELDIPVDNAAIILAIARDPSIHFAGVLASLFGLDPSAPVTATQAAAQVDAALAASEDGRLTYPVALKAAIALKRSFPRGLDARWDGCYDRADLIHALTRRHNNPFLTDIINEVGMVICSSAAYHPRYLKDLASEQKRNEEGCFAKLATRCLAEDNRPQDHRLYQVGRLPESHLAQRARRSTLRKFLKDVWERVQQVSRTGQAVAG